MYIDEISKALEQIFQVYGLTCCVDEIKGHIIKMSNFDEWVFDHDGNIRRYENCWD